LRVLFLSGLTGFGLGGAQTELIRLVDGIRRLDVVPACAIDHQPEELSGVTHFDLEYPPGDEARRQVVEAVSQFKPDCVHLVGGGIGFLRAVDSLQLRVPWVFTAHNLPPFERIFPYFHGNNSLHYFLRNLRALPSVMAWKRFLRNGKFKNVIAHSVGVAEHLAQYGCPAAKIRVIPFGCDVAEPGVGSSPFPADAEPRILTIAGFAHHKGIHDYLEVVKRLTADYPKLTYLVIGNSRGEEYLGFLNRRIKQLGLERNVELIRNASDAVKQAALCSATLYVQPSHEEGFCLAFFEGAMMVPRILGTRAGEMAAVVEEDAGGRVVTSMDLGALERATRELLGANVPAENLERRRERLSEWYSWARYLDGHLRIYEGKPGPPGRR
jgi:glycosyltransferase involved in cell wall biosynthesis